MKFLSAYIAHSLQPAKQAGVINTFPEKNLSSENNKHDFNSLDQAVTSTKSMDGFMGEFPAASYLNNTADEIPVTDNANKRDALGVHAKGLEKGALDTVIKPVINDSMSFVTSTGAELTPGESIEQQSTNLQLDQTLDQHFSEMTPTDSSSLSDPTETENYSVYDSHIEFVEQKNSNIASAINSTNKIDINESSVIARSDNSESINQNLIMQTEDASSLNPVDSENSVNNKNQQAVAIDKNVTAQAANNESQTLANNTDQRPELLAEYKQSETSNPEQQLRRPLTQSESRSEEIPQVRIGQVNVLIDDQASTKNRRCATKVTTQSLNTFGLSGL